MQATLQHPEWLDKPDADQPFVTHDLHRTRSNAANGKDKNA
jgi:hypothetical protein